MLINVRFDTSKLTSKYSNLMSPNGEIQSMIDKEILRGVTPYVPFKTGRLSMSAKSNTKVGSGSIVWTAPYAKQMYRGTTKNGRDMVYNKSKHPLAGPMWTERYKANHINELKQMIIKKVKSV